MAALVAFSVVGGTAYSAVDPTPVTGNPIVRIAVISSAVMSLGSTLIPTARGIEAMADAGEVPSWAGALTRTSRATAVVTVASVAWTGLLFVSEGLFNDTIEALSVLVGLYFTANSLIAALHGGSGGERVGQAVSVGLMALITAAVGIQTLDPAYGETAVGGADGVGGVGLIVIGLCAIGGVGALRYGARRAAEGERRAAEGGRPSALPSGAHDGT